MGGLRSRNKGQRGEREIVKLLQPVVSKVEDELSQGLNFDVRAQLHRNQNQTFNGGHDIGGLDWLCLEVKYQEQSNVRAWWEQTVRQAKAAGGEPVLIHRKNYGKWQVRMMGYLPAGDKRIKTPVDVTLETFMLWFEHRLRHELSQ